LLTTKAYSPQESAVGTLNNGMDIMILYIEEFKEVAEIVNKLENKRFTYNWFQNQAENAYVLQVLWNEDLYIAIKFGQPHFPLLANMIEPRNVLITTVPIKELIIDQKGDTEVELEFGEDVLTLSNIVFEDPKTFYN